MIHWMKRLFSDKEMSKLNNKWNKINIPLSSEWTSGWTNQLTSKWKKERKDKIKKDIAKEEKCKLDRQKLMSEASFLYKVILTIESETKDTDCTKKDSLLKYLFLRNERKEKNTWKDKNLCAPLFWLRVSCTNDTHCEHTSSNDWHLCSDSNFFWTWSLKEKKQIKGAQYVEENV